MGRLLIRRWVLLKVDGLWDWVCGVPDPTWCVQSAVLFGLGVWVVPHYALFL